ncbi:hypothetical protein NCCP133_00640 [Cytobacillus sp. NCCP-133]|nr:hypothetical protein NCCP133_00640 [Cytobacillus sp. NCCP-133]
MREFAHTVIAPDYSPKEKHPVIFNTFDSLKEGEYMQIVNDHDPRPLRYQFLMERENQFLGVY